jgi:predicted site-specific integrase-resolvase
MPQKPTTMLTSAQTAAILGVSTARVRRLSQDGRLPFKTSPEFGYRLYPKPEIVAIAAAKRRERET